MASSFPKMQKSSASFSQSIRNRLRLKKLQAQAKNFCRVLDIRVTQAVKIKVFNAQLGLDDVVAVLGCPGLDIGAVCTQGNQVQLLGAGFAEQVIAVLVVAAVSGTEAQAALQLACVLPTQDRPDCVVQRNCTGGFVFGLSDEPAADVLHPLHLSLDGERSLLQVNVLPHETEHLAQPESAVIRQHHRQVAGVSFREPCEDSIQVPAADGIALHVALVLTLAGGRQQNVFCRVVLNPLLPLGVFHGVADDAQQVRQRVATVALIVQSVDEPLDVLGLDGGEAILAQLRPDVILDALRVALAGGVLAVDRDVVFQP